MADTHTTIPWHDRITERTRVRDCTLLFAAWALPSFVIGVLADFDVAGMLFGLALYFAALLFVATQPVVSRKLRWPYARAAVTTAFQVRLFMLVVVPIAVINDGVCGAVCLAVVYVTLGPPDSFLPAVATTLLLGAVLTAECMGLVWLGSMHPGNLKPPPRNVCLECGYDLRGCVSDRCPECGWAIP